jgi:hypothetical protein
MKKTFGLAAAAVLTFSLTACGDDGGDGGGDFDEQAYCDAYKAADEEFESMSGADFNAEAFGDVQDRISELSDQAPPELEDEWGQMEDAFAEFETILGDAGLSFEDLSGIGEGELPEGVSVEDLEKVGQELDEWSQNSGFEEASDAIEKDAEKRCDVPAEGGES